VSDHDERALAEAFALGALDAPERKLFEAHLGSCRICREAVGGAAVAAQAIAFTAPREAPPSGSGDRLVALYRQQRAAEGPSGRGGGLGGTLAVVFALGALGVSGWGYHEHERVAGLDKKVDELQQKTTELQKRVESCHTEKDILQASDLTWHRKFVPTGGWTGTTEVMVAHSPTKGVVIVAPNLPAPPEGKCYKLWSVAGSVEPMRAFQPGVVIDKSPGGADIKFAISEEDDPNAPKATRVILLPG
jgi:hypothetical protein